MAGSLRVRLWFSYLIVIAISIFVVMIGLLWTLQRSGYFYRQTAQNIQITAKQVQRELFQGERLSEETLAALLSEYHDESGVSLAVLAENRTVLAQQGFDDIPADPQLMRKLDNRENAGTVLTYRDDNRRLWYYVFLPIGDRFILLAAAPRPVVGLLTFLRQVFEPALVLVAFVALVLALVTSLLMANWIVSPLQHISSAARELAQGKYQQIKPEGPEDVRQLAITFNDMVSRVKASQQSQHDFLANVSHELKTPLTSIQGFSQAILDNAVETPEDLQHAAGIIYEEANRMNRLVLDLLSLSRLETGLIDFDFLQLDLSSLLHSVVDRIAFQLKDRELSTEFHTENIPAVRGDGERLAQVFMNLLDNAIKFSPRGGKITIKAAQVNQFVEVQIIDEGPGIPSEQRLRIFERFYQTDKSRKRKEGGGVGLGLAIAQQIIKAHHGTIWVESPAPVDAKPTSGSIFIVRLPIYTPEVNQ